VNNRTGETRDYVCSRSPASAVHVRSSGELHCPFPPTIVRHLRRCVLTQLPNEFSGDRRLRHDVLPLRNCLEPRTLQISRTPGRLAGGALGCGAGRRSRDTFCAGRYSTGQATSKSDAAGSSRARHLKTASC